MVGRKRMPERTQKPVAVGQDFASSERRFLEDAGAPRTQNGVAIGRDFASWGRWRRTGRRRLGVGGWGGACELRRENDVTSVRSMLSGELLRVLALVCAAVVSVGLCGATWPIEIDGKKVDAPWYALSDTPEKLAVGDALYVGNENGGLWLCVRDTESLRFVNRLQSEALLYRKVGEKLEVVGLDALSEKGVETPTTLWGLRVAYTRAGLQLLTRCSARETFATVEVARGAALVPAPNWNGRCVELQCDESFLGNLWDLVGAETRLLMLRSPGFDPAFDPRPMAKAKALRVLTLQNTMLSAPLPWAEWAGIHSLSLWSVFGLDELSEPLDRCVRLDSLELVNCQIRELPMDRLSRIRRLRLVGSSGGAAEIVRFRQQYPYCPVDVDRLAVLREELRGCDRLLVRTGGLYPFECDLQNGERTLHETREGAEIAALIGLFAQDDEWLGGACMCDGSLTLEFHRGARKVAELSLHHGRALRSSMFGMGDIELSTESANAFGRWLLAHGVPDPLGEFSKEQKVDTRRERQIMAFTAAMEDPLRQLLPLAEGLGANRFGALLPLAYPDEVERALAGFKLLGAAPEEEWHATGPRSIEVGSVVSEIGLPAIERAILAAFERSDVRYRAGAAHWAWGPGRLNYEKLENDELGWRCLERCALWTAQSPHAEMRESMVRRLEWRKQPWSLGILREIAALRSDPRVAPADYAPLPPPRNKPDVPEGTPVALHAVLALARLGDAQAAELLGKARALARAEDAVLVARIEALLKDPKLAEEDRKTSGEATLGRGR